MQRNLIFTAVFAAFSLFFSPLTLAEESPGFVAHNEALAQQRSAVVHAHSLAGQLRADEARDG